MKASLLPPPAVARSERGVPGTMRLTAPPAPAVPPPGKPLPQPRTCPRTRGRARPGGQRKQVQKGKLSTLLPVQGFRPKLLDFVSRDSALFCVTVVLVPILVKRHNDPVLKWKFVLLPATKY